MEQYHNLLSNKSLPREKGGSSLLPTYCADFYSPLCDVQKEIGSNVYFEMKPLLNM